MSHPYFSELSVDEQARLLDRLAGDILAVFTNCLEYSELSYNFWIKRSEMWDFVKGLDDTVESHRIFVAFPCKPLSVFTYRLSDTDEFSYVSVRKEWGKTILNFTNTGAPKI